MADEHTEVGFTLADKLSDFCAPQVRLTVVGMILVSPKLEVDVCFSIYLEVVLKDRLSVSEGESCR